VDAIILAAGENVRLQAAGLAPGRKPLIIRDGEVLIRRLCRQVVSHVSEIIIVVSPANVEDIIFATKEFHPYYVVQPSATGPQRAVDLALHATHSSSHVLLMGDNFIQEYKHYTVTREGGPGVYVSVSDDIHLHAIDDDGRFMDEQDRWVHARTRTRWLGPVYFSNDEWTCGRNDWVSAFKGTEFTLLKRDDIEDMGTL